MSQTNTNTNNGQYRNNTPEEMDGAKALAAVALAITVIVREIT